MSSSANINFNNENLWGKAPEYGLGDSGGGSSDTTYWFFTGVGNNSSLIHQYEYFATLPEDKYDGFDSVTNPCPHYMTVGDANTGLSKVSVGAGVLERTLVPVPTSAGPERDSCVDVPDGGLYIDMLVKYDTGFVNLPKPEFYQEANAKVAFGILNDGTYQNRFFVTAGCWRDGVFASTNYVTSVELSTEKWYRITARMLANAATASGESYPAFVIYVDGQRVCCGDIQAYEKMMGSDGAALFKGDEHFTAGALFPSLQRPGGDHYADKAYSVGFQGLGYVDDIGFSNNVFAVETNQIDFTVLCDNAALTQLVYSASVDGVAYSNGTLKSGFDGFVIPARPGATIELEPYAAPKIALSDALTVNGNVGAVASSEAYTVNFRSGAKFDDCGRVTATITSKDAYFSANGQNYTRFNDALSAIEPGGTIKVVQDVELDGSARTENGQIRVKPSQRLIIDLNGQRIKGEHFDDEAAIYNQGNLQIVDTVGGGSIEAPGTVLHNDWTEVSTNQALDVNHAVATLTLGDKEPKDKLFTVRGRVTCTAGNLIICTGRFLTPADEPNPDAVFYLSEYVDPSGRYSVDPTPAKETEGWYWTVCWNNEYVIRFRTPHGSVTPESVIVDATTPVDAPTLDAPGYDFGGWYEGGTLVELPKTFDHDATLTASLSPHEYTVTNDWFLSDFPTNYTVETTSVALREPSRPLFTFGGWQDKSTGNYVTNVGAGACFVGTTSVVTGNLDLVARWVSVPITWSNAVQGQAESNGTYSGTWKLTIPATSELLESMKVKITQISLCVVNPTQYGRAGDRLAIRTAGGEELYVSGRRADLSVDPMTKEYLGVTKLANGRTRVAYDFSAANALVTVGEENELFFASDDVGTLGSGFLRLINSTRGLIGPCDGSSPASPSEAYSGFRPVYEIIGEAQP